MRIIFFILFITLCSCQSFVNTIEPKIKKDTSPFITPEKTIEYFFDRIKNEDLDGALDACIPETMSSKFDYLKSTERMDAMFYYGEPAPPNSDFLININKTMYCGYLSRQILFYCYYLLTDESDFDLIVGFPSEQRVKEFITALDTSKLKKLKIIDIFDSRANFTNTNNIEKIVERAKQQSRPFGADTNGERLVLIEFNGKYYMGGISLYLYDDTWLIYNLMASFIKINPAKLIRLKSKIEYYIYTGQVE